MVIGIKSADDADGYNWPWVEPSIPNILEDVERVGILGEASAKHRELIAITIFRNQKEADI